jgi:hypothetical protein
MTILTLSSTGVSPKAASVSGGSSVNIVNSDSVSHQLASNSDSQQAKDSSGRSNVVRSR